MSTRYQMGLGTMLALLATLSMGGCEGVPLSVAEVGSRSSDVSGCPVGSDECDYGNPNGQGIYNIEGGEHCLQTPAGTFCPTGFSTLPGSLHIEGIFDRAGTWNHISVPVSGLLAGVTVTPVSMSAPDTRVTVQYVDASGQEHALAGEALDQLILEFDVGGTHFQLALLLPGDKPIDVNTVVEYAVMVRVEGVSNWESLCKDIQGDREPASFLGGATFDPFEATRATAPYAVTMSCQKGGITTCMEWGYRPWQLGVNTATKQDELLASAHAACIQMKRAAYCGHKSYTKDGTLIEIADPYDPSLQQSAVKDLEAIWTPAGAACLNVANRRHTDIPFAGCLPALPPCPSSKDPSTWWPSGILASGVLPPVK